MQQGCNEMKISDLSTIAKMACCLKCLLQDSKQMADKGNMGSMLLNIALTVTTVTMQKDDDETTKEVYRRLVEISEYLGVYDGKNSLH